jgi:hypothetical protein
VGGRQEVRAVAHCDRDHVFGDAGEVEAVHLGRVDDLRAEDPEIV